jgi:hypothetical protein
MVLISLLTPEDIGISRKMGSLPADFFVSSTAFTKTTHIHKYNAIDPTSVGLSQNGKIVIVTGANRGLGRKVSYYLYLEKNELNMGADLQRLLLLHLRKQTPRPLFWSLGVSAL